MPSLGSELGVDAPRPAAVSFLHLFGSALNLHPHNHSLLPDAVFWRRGDRVEIVPLLAPTDDEVEAICAQAAWRVRRLLEARLEQGLVDATDDSAAAQQLVPPTLPLPWDRRVEVDFEHPADRGRLCAEVDRRSILQANDELVLSPDADGELLSLERVMTAGYPNLRRRILEDMFSR